MPFGHQGAARRQPGRVRQGSSAPRRGGIGLPGDQRAPIDALASLGSRDPHCQGNRGWHWPRACGQDTHCKCARRPRLQQRNQQAWRAGIRCKLHVRRARVEASATCMQHGNARDANPNLSSGNASGDGRVAPAIASSKPVGWPQPARAVADGAAAACCDACESGCWPASAGRSRSRGRKVWTMRPPCITTTRSAL